MQIMYRFFTKDFAILVSKADQQKPHPRPKYKDSQVLVIGFIQINH